MWFCNIIGGRTMKGLNLRRIISLVILATFLWYLSACSRREAIYISEGRIPKGLSSEIEESGKVWVTMRNGNEYEFRWIAIQGEKIVGTGIRREPTGRTLRVEREEVPLADAQLISIQKIDAEKTGYLTGCLVGITGVVLLTLWTARQIQQVGENSCPFVYSFDGSSYILDSETYGGAIFRVAERTDYDNLDYLLPVDGKYHLKMTNELPETQHTDEFKLIIVDHPKGTEVVPESGGAIHTISSPVAPLSATDFDGQDFAELIVEKDELFWESNPYFKA